jgi:xanthine dehydrogenase YagR molybdenum-binding subunit
VTTRLDSATAIVDVPPVLDDGRRVDAPDKVSGRARYAFEHRFTRLAHAVGVPSTVATGRVRAIDADAAEAVPGVLAVLTPERAPRLGPGDEPELTRFLQTPEVAFRGQFVAAVVATNLEAAQEAAALVRVEYEAGAADVTLRTDHPGLYAPEVVNPNFPTDSVVGDPDGALAAAAVGIDATYSTPPLHNNAMEPHAAVAVWDGDHLTVHDSTQGPPRVQAQLAKLFGLEPGQVRVLAEHVGGGFGSKGAPRVNVVLAAMAARVVGRPVKCALTRQQMFTVSGYRTPTIQQVQLGADAEGHLTAIAHDVWEQTSTVKEFAEQTAVATRHMYAAPHRRTTHRLVRLDVPTPAWMRAPGECPGMYALESGLDELAVALGLDPIELRLRNEPPTDPETGAPWSSRHLAECLRLGAERFGWADRAPGVRARRDGRWLVGSGVAASTYPARAQPSQARVTAGEQGRFEVAIDAVDIGTGARTALLLTAAAELDVPASLIDLRIADSDLPPAMIAGGSMGLASWTWAVVRACREVKGQLAERRDARPPAGGLVVAVDTKDDVAALPERARYSFGAQFAEVRVDLDTGEVRVPRLLGVFAAGRIVNPRTARSQFVGGMTMGLSMALHEESVVDREFGDFVNHDLAGYHVAANADVGEVEAIWIDEVDDLGPLGAKGIGEIGIVGTAAAVANAVHHATGVRVRDLPIRLDRLLAGLAAISPS